ncbi:MAG: helix-turn-helix transcriptional regulator [Candidatus Saccharimonadales bacterium]|jgi:transcriptional regulator with XRE-family HTH domain
MKDSDVTTRKTAKRLRAIRVERDLTQAQVAEKAKMSANYYAKIERGEVRPSIDMYERIAKALKTTATELFPF